MKLSSIIALVSLIGMITPPFGLQGASSRGNEPAYKDCTMHLEAKIAGISSARGFMEVEVTLISDNNRQGEFLLFVDGTLLEGGPFVYDDSGINRFRIMVSDNAEMHQIFIHDAGDASCSAIIPFASPCKSASRINCDSQTKNEHFTVYPNPGNAASTELTVEGSFKIPEDQPARLFLLTPDGRLIESVETFEFPLHMGIAPDLPAGIYVIKMLIADKSYQVKWIMR